MARLYANENFPLAVVRELRLLGHDVLTSLEAGQANRRIPDDEVLSFATVHKRALLTQNRRDFLRLQQIRYPQSLRHCPLHGGPGFHRTGSPHPRRCFSGGIGWEPDPRKLPSQVV